VQAGATHILGGVGNLDAYVDDAECDTVIANDVIDYFLPSDVDSVIDNWVGKLRTGGQITIGGIDIQEVARQLATKEIDINTANRLIYGDQQQPWQSRKSAITLSHMSDVLTSRNLKVTKRSLKGCFYQVTAERP
jgi:hypothetical protein